METLELQNKVMDEIKLIPESKLQEIYSVIHFFRLGLEKGIRVPKNIMRFAGSWTDMTEQEFDEFTEDIYQRRNKAFSRRTNRETFVD
jgi:hypothetical protein